MPAEVKRIICLANSRKYNGRCIAGVEVINRKPGDWVRPVGFSATQELNPQDCALTGGIQPAVLDILEVPLESHSPVAHQPENWLISRNAVWIKVGRCPVASLERLCIPEGHLWMNGIDSKNGKNNRIHQQFYPFLGVSLKLIRVSSLDVVVAHRKSAEGKEELDLRALFAFAGVWYKLSLTDTEMERSYCERPDGLYRLGPHYITLSLSEPFLGHIYKLAAAIIEIPE